MAKPVESVGVVALRGFKDGKEQRKEGQKFETNRADAHHKITRGLCALAPGQEDKGNLSQAPKKTPPPLTEEKGKPAAKKAAKGKK